MDHKPWKNYPEQLELLQSRGLIVDDSATALQYLEYIGYYRLHGYWFPFRIRNQDGIPQDQYQFKSGATFQNAVDLYCFDKKLRLLVLDAIESIEIAVRVEIAHTLSKIDPLAYVNPDNFQNSFSKKLLTDTTKTKHQEWLEHHNKLVGRSTVELIRHNRKKYGLPLPIWMVCEAWDFGCLSRLFDGMKREHQDPIAYKYGLMSNGSVFASWLHSLNYLRNVCAHHSRLWNCNIIRQPKKYLHDELDWYELLRNDNRLKVRPFLLFCIITHILQRIYPISSWPQRLKDRLASFPDLTHLGLNLYGMGAPDGWQKLVVMAGEQS